MLSLYYQCQHYGFLFFFLCESICCDQYCHHFHKKDAWFYHFNYLHSTRCLQEEEQASVFLCRSASSHNNDTWQLYSHQREQVCSEKIPAQSMRLHIDDTTMCTTVMAGKRHLLTYKHVRDSSRDVVTYVCVRSLIRPWAAECDKFMAPLVDHKTANCRGRKETRGQCWEREIQRERNTRTDGERQTTKRRERVRWLKYSVSLLIDM